ncbi:phage tail protein [Flavobacterium endoglycinae]|uniref:Phage tail protein n=1 Tax=Flavobacterium endoglycinae TaxID=2816357 RepID=A0ABX7QCR3_9FLAO|nr:tail fiber protein [Flavobacterium endoglycinae]QSW88747.1 phage tail protein [Flavobacterium endoglycinae]
MEGYLSEIRIFAGNFPPRGWVFCNGSQLPISNYDALYALIGTTYGGDGVTTFNIPDLRGRVPIGTGQGPGLSPIVLGQVIGTESTTMTTNQMPAHNHVGTGSLAIPVYKGAGNIGAPTDSVLAGLTNAYSSAAQDSALKPQTVTLTVSATGGNIPFSIIQPYLSTNYIICIEGIFPSRN